MNEEWVGALPSLQDHNIELSSHCLANKNIFTMNDAADFEKKTINIAFNRDLHILAFVGRLPPFSTHCFVGHTYPASVVILNSRICFCL